MTVLVRLCSGYRVLWVNVWLGLVGTKILAFWKIQLDLLILCCHVLKVIAFVDAGGFLALGYEISVR